MHLKTNTLSSLVALDTSRALTEQNRRADKIAIRRIPVKAGDSISISATVLDKTRRGRQFWGNVAKAVTPGFVVGALGASKGEEPTSGDQTIAAPTIFATTLAITPGMVNLLKRQGNPKAFIGLTAYDTSGRPVDNIIGRMTKAARKDWETLDVGYRVREDGFVTILGGRDVSSVSVLDSEDPNQWIKFALHRTNGTNRIAAPNAEGLALSPASGVDGPQTNGLSVCIDWYLCGSEGCQYTGETQCYSLDDGGGGDNSTPGSDYGGKEPANCVACKRLAQREHDKNLVAAKAILYTAIGVCAVGGFETGVKLNAVGSWLHLIPGIGTAAIEALAALGAVTVGISCITPAVYVFNAAVASIENSYFKDMNDCNEKYCSPPPRDPIPTPNN